MSAGNCHADRRGDRSAVSAAACVNCRQLVGAWSQRNRRERVASSSVRKSSCAQCGGSGFERYRSRWCRTRRSGHRRFKGCCLTIGCTRWRCERAICRNQWRRRDCDRNGRRRRRAVRAAAAVTRRQLVGPRRQRNRRKRVASLSARKHCSTKNSRACRERHRTRWR